MRMLAAFHDFHNASASIEWIFFFSWSSDLQAVFPVQRRFSVTSMVIQVVIHFIKYVLYIQPDCKVSPLFPRLHYFAHLLILAFLPSCVEMWFCRCDISSTKPLTNNGRITGQECWDEEWTYSRTQSWGTIQPTTLISSHIIRGFLHPTRLLSRSGSFPPIRLDALFRL